VTTKTQSGECANDRVLVSSTAAGTAHMGPDERLSKMDNWLSLCDLKSLKKRQALVYPAASNL